MGNQQQCLAWLRKMYGSVQNRSQYLMSAAYFGPDHEKCYKFYRLDKIGSMVQEAFQYNANGYDVYYGIGISKCSELRKITIKGQERDIYRFSTCDVNCFPFAAIDFDIGKNDQLPATLDIAREAIEEAPFEVDSITFTGNGLHLYWRLSADLIDNDNRDHKKQENECIHRAVKDYFTAQYRWNLDNTQDLARLDRLPCTINHRHGNNIQGGILK